MNNLKTLLLSSIMINGLLIGYNTGLDPEDARYTKTSYPINQNYPSPRQDSNGQNNTQKNRLRNRKKIQKNNSEEETKRNGLIHETGKATGNVITGAGNVTKEATKVPGNVVRGIFGGNNRD